LTNFINMANLQQHGPCPWCGLWTRHDENCFALIATPDRYVFKRVAPVVMREAAY
jgi:hypothetical protein